MGALNFLYHPDTTLTASKLETLALDLLSEIPIPGVEAAAFNSGIIRQTILQAAVDQKSIKAVTDTIRGTYSDDYTLAQLHTVPADEFEAVVNDLLVQQAAMILPILRQLRVTRGFIPILQNKRLNKSGRHPRNCADSHR